MELLITLPILVFIYITYTLFKNMKKKGFDPSDVPSLTLSYEEYYKTLNFMLMYGIITNEEYNRFLSKGSPFIG
jgi:hypothetical protein